MRSLLLLILPPLLLGSCTTQYPGTAAIATRGVDVQQDVMLTIRGEPPVLLKAGGDFVKGLAYPIPGHPAVTTCFTIESRGTVRAYDLTSTVDTSIYAFISSDAAVGAVARPRIMAVDADDEMPSLVERPRGTCT